ncbi:MAG: DASH family cryptochrome [Cyanophyceae cyanobacterium]
MASSDSTNPPAKIVWFRNDLRVADCAPLFNASRTQSTVIPVYCFDPRHFGKTAFGFAKTGSFRAKFLLESVEDLRRSLQSLGSDLIIRWGKPEDIIPSLVQQTNADAIYCHKEVTHEEKQVDAKLSQAIAQLARSGSREIKTRRYWGATLHSPNDLPFEISQIPELFTRFRKDVEKNCQPRDPLPAPKSLPALPENLSPGELPTWEQLGLTPPQSDPRGVLDFIGGAAAAGDRLKQYFWEGDHLRRYKQTRNGLLGADYSSKFSPWLALGCISPRQIWDDVLNYEEERVANDSTYWLIFELLWRDYFRWISAKHGNKIFLITGLQGAEIPWKQDWERFELWRDGKTGYPFIDANMRELAATGFMSNRGRQNVASFLTKNLGIDWRMGAEYFESVLVDYDVCSNWGNWNYTAGVGNDARGFRFFNVIKQAKDYDGNGDYVKHWIPQFQSVSRPKLHTPWLLTRDEQNRSGLNLGVDYPNPVVDLFQSAEANEKIYNKALGIQPSAKPSKSHHKKGSRSDKRGKNATSRR